MLLGSLIRNESDEENVSLLYLPHHCLWMCKHGNQRKSWVQWWTDATHLSKACAARYNHYNILSYYCNRNAYTNFHHHESASMGNNASRHKWGGIIEQVFKTLESCLLEYTYCQDTKMSLKHLFAYNGLPISFQRKTLEVYKQRVVRQNKSRRKRLLNLEEVKMTLDLKVSS